MASCKAKFFAVASAILALAVGGCANYHLGTTLPPHLKTIYVATFENHTVEPSIETKITTAVRRRFQFDGQLKIVATEADSDITLKATLTAYDVESLIYDKNSPTTTRRYKARIRCTVDARETATGKVIAIREVIGETTFPAAGDTVTARRNAVNDVARELAEEVVDAVIGAW